MQLVIGRIGRPHGIRGEVTLEVRTDTPELRFAPGSTLATDPVERGPLTVLDSWVHSSRWILSIVGVEDRGAAESLRDTLLTIDTAELPPIEDPEEFYDHQLIGLAARLRDGSDVGVVHDVIHGPAGDLLAIRRPDERELLVPFLRDMVPVVDVAAGYVVLDPPEGLLEL